jgi:hypothetical protein
MTDSAVKVIFRFRSEAPGSDLSEWIIEPDQKGLYLGPERSVDRSFSFDATLQPSTSQEQVYEEQTKSQIL